MKIKNYKTPFIAKFFLTFFINHSHPDEILGDYDEIYCSLAAKKGKIIAGLWYWFQIILLIPPFFNNSIYWSAIMFKNYFKIAYRNIIRHKIYSLINISGLSIGFASAIVILLFVSYELSYDNYHQDLSQIYRVALKSQTPLETRYSAKVSAPVAAKLKDDFPQVENVTKILNLSRGAIKYKENNFYEENRMMSDSELFSIFSIPFLQGDPKSSLNKPNTVVITERMAQKYFGIENPLGKLISINSNEYEVTGVAENAPVNTHLKYDFILSFKTVENRYPVDEWLLSNFHVYCKVKPNTQMPNFNSKIIHLSNPYIGAKLKEIGEEITFFTQPVKDIHLYSHLRNEAEPPGNPTNLIIFSIVGLLILIIAGINFINLTTARSVNRAKEVGIRKVVGGTRKELISQFIGESTLLSVIAFIISIIMVVMVLPAINNLANISLTFNNVHQVKTILISVGILLFTILVSGFYPSFVLSGFQPVKVLKGITRSESGGAFLRKSLVILQFSASIILIICTFIVYNQINFMKDKNLGFSKEQKLIIQARSSQYMQNNFETVKSEFAQISSVTGVTISSDIPGRGGYNCWDTQLTGEGNRSYAMNYFYVDHDFFSEYEMEILAGRNFKREITSDNTDTYILNEAAVKSFGWLSNEEAIGKLIEGGRMIKPRKIIGIVKNFHYQGLQSEIEPMVLEYSPRQFDYINLSVNTTNFKEAINLAEEKWNKLFPTRPFEYFFLDDDFNKQYMNEEKFGQLFTILTFIGLFIAFLGLLGLTSFSTAQRTKEIGIRKIMGASTSGIIILLTKEFCKWILYANIIAWPIAWYIMKNWLHTFAYKTDIHFSIFLFSGLLTLMLALLTIILQAQKAAATNPVNALKYE